jgi:PAS domain S-box-containing protein
MRVEVCLQTIDPLPTTMTTLPSSPPHARQINYRRQLALIGLITAVTVCAGWIGLRTVEQKLIAASGETISALATEVAAKIDLLLEERYYDIRTLAVMASHPRDASGAIHTFHENHPSYLWIGLADGTGLIRSATDPRTIGRTVRRSDWYMAVHWGQEVFVGDVRPDEMIDGAEAVTFAAPVKPADKHSSGAAIVSTRWGLAAVESQLTETIRAFQQRVGLFHAVEYQVVRDDGLVLLDSDLAHKGNVNLKEMGLRSLLLAASGTPGYLEERHLRRGVPVVTGYARAADASGSEVRLDWTVLLRVDRADVLEPVTFVLWIVTIAALLIAGPLIGLLIAATRQAHREWMAAEGQRVRSYENERRLQTILEVDPEGVLVLDGDRRIVQINPAGCALFAAAFPEEVVGKDLVHYVHPDDRAGFERGHQAAVHGRGIVAAGRLLGLGGSVLWVEMTAVLLPKEGELKPSVLAVLRDVSEQRRSERRQALQHAVAKVLAGATSVEQALPDVLRAIATVLNWDAGLCWRVREDRRLLSCVHTWAGGQATAQALVSASHGQAFTSGVGLPGRCWARGEPVWIADLSADVNLARGQASGAASMRAGCAFPIWLRANVFGVMEFFSRDAHPPDTDLLRTLGIVGSQIGLFIERTEVEAALRENESRTRLILDTAMDAVIAMDARGVITDWNAQAETMFGWTHHEAVGLDLAETIIPPLYRMAHREGLARFCRTGKGAVLNTLIEITGLRRDGTEFPIELAISTLRLEGTVIFSAFIRDITARKESERALTDYAQQLERINHQLDAALREAQAATEAKSSFLATMSHEIRTPMNGIIGMTGLLLDTELSPEQREYAETVRHCGDHLLMLINDILDFSKIEAGKLSLEAIDFDVRVAIEEAVDLLAARASSMGLNLACLFHADVPRALVGDPGRLRQIVMNLAANAVKFTERGEVVIHVSTEGQTEQEATIRVAVTDTGIGISDEAQQRLFQSFSQADGSTTRKYGGTGLGLAISKRLVEMMGGTIGVTSRVGEGSCFWFTIRFKKSRQLALSAEPSRDRLQGRRVLIMEEKATNRRILEELTAKWGMQPTLLEGGPALLDLLARQTGSAPFDLALLDLDMIAVDALELARAISGRPEWAHVRLVLLTSLGRRGDAKAAREAGVAAYLTKPIREAQLYESLVAALDASHPVRAGESSAHRGSLVTRHTVAEAKARGERRILLAEDNVVNQKVAVRLFERLGYRVDVVANGREAVDAVARTHYDLVFMDGQMPEMDGFEATQHIRENEARHRSLATGEESASSPLTNGRAPRTAHHVPIVAMTANVMEGDRERCLAAGMDDYVSKPITLDALAGAIERHLPADAAQHARLASNESAIDPLIFAGLRELAGEEAPDFLPSLIAHFLSDVPDSVNKMRDAFATADMDELARLAHRLKGGASNVGALGLAELCDRAQRHADSADPAWWGQWLAEIDQEFARVRAALEGHGPARGAKKAA